MEGFVAFGRVERIKKVWQVHNKTNTFYFCFDNAESAALSQSKTNNMDFIGHKFLSLLQDARNLADKENDYIPKCDLEIFLTPDPKHEIVPIFYLVIAEEGQQSAKNL